jgi:GAF domain-containing protein
MDRETELTAAFVKLADTLVDDFDIIEFLERVVQRCARLLGADAVGVLLTDASGELALAAASSKQMQAVELFQVQQSQGPCWDAYQSGEQVIADNLAHERHRWPKMAPRALELGLVAVHAFPMRLREKRIGALNLFSSHTGPLTETDIRVAQAMADIATIGIIHARQAQAAEQVSTQLQYALDARVVVEQAKGVLAAQHNMSPADAFELMRDYARPRQLRIREVAQAVLDGLETASEEDVSRRSGTPSRHTPALGDTSSENRRVRRRLTGEARSWST